MRHALLMSHAHAQFTCCPSTQTSRDGSAATDDGSCITIGVLPLHAATYVLMCCWCAVQYATDEHEKELLERMSGDEVLHSTWCQSQSVR